MLRSLLVYVCLVTSLCVAAQDNRSIDGTGNNLSRPSQGAAGDHFSRLTSTSYTDGISTPDLGGPNPRIVSNELFAQTATISDNQALSDFTWAFAQFIKHDLSQMSLSDTEILDNIIAPADDSFFEAGTVIETKRAVPAPRVDGQPQNYINEVTSYLDASTVYGSTVERSNWLRAFEGGKLKTSAGELLPWNTVDGEFNSEVDPTAPFMLDEAHQMRKYFVAGDTRANENPLLLAIHTIMLREHNRVCDVLASRHPQWNDERLFQRARKLVGATLQAITYNEWLPTLGLQVPRYTGYKSTTDSKVMNIFASAAFQLSSTLVNSDVVRMDYDGNEMVQGNITLGEAFYSPETVLYVGGIDSYIKGMATQVQQNLDCKMIDAVRNFDYGSADKTGTDRAATTINKGRDTGLPTYNRARIDLGLPGYNGFDDLTSDPEAQTVLEQLYGSIDQCDVWVGMLAEDHLPGSMFGQLTGLVIERQFQVLRDGDRYYYENDPVLTSEEVEEISRVTMKDLIVRNTAIDVVQDNVFTAMAHDNLPDGPDLLPLRLEAAVYPNPVDHHMIAKFYMDYQTVVEMTVVNSMGVQVYNNDFLSQRGDNKVRISLSDDITPGLYYLMISADGEFTTLKFVKQ